MNWKRKRVLVTGGASFIGSHLTDKLCQLGAEVRVVDNLSSGTLENLSDSPGIDFQNQDLEYSTLEELERTFRDQDVVFHLAATHGGRGYIDTHPADVCSNFSIDHHVLEACHLTGVDKVVFASSACVYPPSLQAEKDTDYLLRETDSDILKLDQYLSSDLEYGWAKLMGEMQLNAFIKQYGMKGCTLRFVTAYGERENETHAIIALIHKAHERMNPYAIWGNGEQSRDFTYVSDIVDGTVLAAEKIDNGLPINLGTGCRFKLKDVAMMIFDIMDFHPEVTFDTNKPTGVISRALDIARAKSILGWEPRISLREGLEKTAHWYAKTHSPKGMVNERLLMERAQDIRGTGISMKVPMVPKRERGTRKIS
jgi:nucleoside-diphosphate-sugar epimerase